MSATDPSATDPSAIGHSGITRIESLGSIWMIDNDLRRYCRFPKHEAPRERPEWGGPDAGALQDAVWHEFAGEWSIDDDGFLPFLRIQVRWDEEHQDWWVVKAPDARELTSAG